MINPSATSKHYGRVIKVRTAPDGSLDLTVLLESGHLMNELGFIYHRSLKAGDLVACIIGFSIMSDCYGVKSVSKLQRRNKRYAKTEALVSRQSPFTALKQNLRGA